jgi:hypothetical protein
LAQVEVGRPAPIRRPALPRSQMGQAERAFHKKRDTRFKDVTTTEPEPL